MTLRLLAAITLAAACAAPPTPPPSPPPASLPAGPRADLDLHTHSYCSDGILTPEALVREAKAAGLRWFSLTDHDTTACLERAAAAAKKEGIQLLAGMEISTEDDGVHILGVGIDPKHPQLVAFVRAQQQARFARLETTLGKLRAAGLTYDMKDDILLPKLNREREADGKPPIAGAEAAGMTAADVARALHGQITRPDLARVMVARGDAKFNQDAFDKYLGAKGSAYVPLQGPPFREAIAWIHAAGGVAVLAHPQTIWKRTKFPVTYSGKTYAAFEELATDLLGAGLDGFEVHRLDPDAPETRTRLAPVLAAHRDKTGRAALETPGSDYHGGKASGIGGQTLGSITIPAEAWADLSRALRLR